MNKSGVTYNNFTYLLGIKTPDSFFQDMNEVLLNRGYSRVYDDTLGYEMMEYKGKKYISSNNGIRDVLYTDKYNENITLSIKYNSVDDVLIIQSIDLDNTGNAILPEDIDGIFTETMQFEREILLKDMYNDTVASFSENVLLVDWIVKLALSLYMMIH